MDGRWAARAEIAERAVREHYLTSVFGVPGALLGLPRHPATPADHARLRWNYWWQAHLLDCLVDAQLRAPEHARARVIARLVRGIRLRNLGAWTNAYYDDIAWLGLALLRAGAATGLPVRRPVAAILARLRSGWTEHAGGGIWWRRGDLFKNVPANGPAAILFARTGAADRAAAALEWMDRTLLDARTGLLWDGVHLRPDGSVRERVEIVYTYCQGVFLGACVELSTSDLAARTIRAVDEYVAVGGVLPGQGGGDGGLFAGILARYLAQSALRLPDAEGERARALVFDSAEAAWQHRTATAAGPVFGADWTHRSPQDPRLNGDLSVQLSGWMVIEAAALLERASMTV
ncbi:putative alpha-1,6-mannanase (GH76 family) [Actinokineospora auranticolor]|uniref:Putative alpha-1,6-mannanase (GH76 family) n=1 Tax=Actinokineospora auranticolor TaxID=155976 RepID=A0A2S6GRQ0_9PSEU|nr:putative alpha-1,6-mannanase (GH76 family) [Actinokineospora auranticolor]